MAVSAHGWPGRRPEGGKLPLLLLLTVPGRKSGTPHTVPVAYLDHDGGYLVVGTGMGGSRRTPQWFLNFEAAGKGHTRIAGREHDVDAHLASGAERNELWPPIAARAPHFARWQVRTGRELPVAVLTVNAGRRASAAVRFWEQNGSGGRFLRKQDQSEWQIEWQTALVGASLGLAGAGLCSFSCWSGARPAVTEPAGDPW